MDNEQIAIAHRNAVKDLGWIVTELSVTADTFRDPYFTVILPSGQFQTRTFRADGSMVVTKIP